MFASVGLEIACAALVCIIVVGRAATAALRRAREEDWRSMVLVLVYVRGQMGMIAHADGGWR